MTLFPVQLSTYSVNKSNMTQDTIELKMLLLHVTAANTHTRWRVWNPEVDILAASLSAQKWLTSWYFPILKVPVPYFFGTVRFFWNFGKLDFSDCFRRFNVLFLTVFRHSAVYRGFSGLYGNNVGIYTRREWSMAKVRRFWVFRGWCLHCRCIALSPYQQSIRHIYSHYSRTPS